jgi:uncharacterized protein (TIGR01777 family)
MHLLIIGATGFIGRELVKELELAGHQVLAVSRSARKAGEIFGNQTKTAAWDGKSAEGLAALLPGIDGIVNLAGENIAAGRWTEKRKEILTRSRVQTGKLLAAAVRLSESKPEVIIQGSAIGLYGTPVENPSGESLKAGTGFLSELTAEWESSVLEAGPFVKRIVMIRTGLVLGQEGLLEKMLLPFRFYCGTTLGNGRQWLSWIHIRDEVRAIRFLLESRSSSGPYNLTSPGPVKMQEFIKSISQITHKPAWFKVPRIILKAALGEMAEQTILSSQNIYPEKLLKEGFQFDFRGLTGALENLLTGKKAF